MNEEVKISITKEAQKALDDLRKYHQLSYSEIITLYDRAMIDNYRKEQELYNF